MTLPLSGTLEASDINVELGRSATATISLKDAETGVYGAINTCSFYHPNGLAPYAISDWYGYDHNAACLNSYYAMSDGGVAGFNGLYSNTLSYDTSVSSFKPDPSNACSWSFWFKPITTIEQSGIIYTLVKDPNTKIGISWYTQEDGANPGTYINKLLFEYSVDDGSGSGYIDSEVDVSDSSNSGISGVSSSAVWGIGNYGNVDTNDYVLISLIVDYSQYGTNDFVQWYWNDTRLDCPYQSGAYNISFTNADNPYTPSWSGAVMCIGGTNFGDETASYAQLDGFAIYISNTLAPSDVSVIYNGGQVASLATYQGISTDLLYYNFESNTPNIGNDTGNNYDFNLDEYNSPQRVADPAA